MGSTAELLASVSGRLEAELRPRLQGLFGGLVRAYLPQSWVFRTEQGIASLRVDRDGHVSVVASADPNPDVTVELGYDRLQGALDRSRGGTGSAGPVTVTPHTTRGRTAFDYLRPKLGL